MWHVLRASMRSDPGFVVSVTELVRSTFRNLMYATGAAYAAWHVWATVSSPDTLGPGVWLVTLFFGGTLALTARLLPKRLLLAQVIWLTGLACSIALTLHLFNQPMVAFVYALLPLAAAVILSWPGALLAQAAVMVLLWSVIPGVLGVVLPADLVTAIIICGALGGLIGWSSTTVLMYLAQWSFSGYIESRHAMQDALDQRLALKEVQEDLLKANTELARMFDRLKALNQIAEEARHAKEEFVANVSHELRTPLNMIIGFSEMITESPEVYGAELPPALLTDIVAIKRNSEHLSKLVDDVLDLSQAEAGRMALSKEWSSVAAIVDEAAEAVRALYRSKHLYLRTDVPNDLPDVLCDSTRVRQVVINLLSNAGRFTETGGVSLSVRRAQDGDDRVEFSVADTGPGISEADQQRLFEPFQQLDSSIRRRHGGSGLGLAISKRFVEMHGGRMWLDSRVGVGTTVHFSLPLVMPEPVALVEDGARRWINPYEDADLHVRTRRTRAPEVRLKPRFVVLEPGQVLSRLLRRYASDWDVVRVTTVDGAIGELQRSPAQAVIANTWPDQDVPNTVRRLRDLPYGTPAVVCSVPDDAALAALGISQYLVKPIGRDQLLSALQSVLPANGGPLNTVLLVDDEPEMLQLFARMLASPNGAPRVLRATNGSQALEMLRQRKPDVMVLDLIMPGMDGFQVLQAKQQDAAISAIPVVVVSSHDPRGEPIVSSALTITQSGGVSVTDLLMCTQSVSAILSSAPSSLPSPPDRAQLETSGV